MITIRQLAEKIRKIQLEKLMDYSTKKDAVTPLMYNLSSRIQEIGSASYESVSYNFTEDDASKLFQLVYESASQKGQIYRYFENFIWHELTHLPFRLNSIPEDEVFIELKREYKIKKYDNEKDRINQLLLDFCFKILDLKQNTETRREYALRILVDMQDFYYIPDSYEVFKACIKNMDSTEQYYALEGFERYFLLHEEKIPDELLTELRNIFEKTDIREIASTCIEIEMNLGLIDEMEAVFAMDDWKYDESEEMDDWKYDESEEME